MNERYYNDGVAFENDMKWKYGPQYNQEYLSESASFVAPGWQKVDALRYLLANTTHPLLFYVDMDTLFHNMRVSLYDFFPVAAQQEHHAATATATAYPTTQSIILQETYNDSRIIQSHALLFRNNAVTSRFVEFLSIFEPGARRPFVNTSPFLETTAYK